MKNQKFKRGNLVRVLVGNRIWHNKRGAIDIRPNDVGRPAIVEYSYAEMYGGDDVDSYSIIWCDTGGSLAWKRTHELELLHEGGEYLFEAAKANKQRISKQDTDIGYISEHLENGNLSSESVLMLFELLGFETSFKRNGEFFVLSNDWQRLHPIFVHIKKSNTLEEAKSIFTPEGLLSLNIEKVYHALH